VDYWDAIDYILALPDLERFSSGPAGQTMSLDAMKALLARLGNPERGRKTVHVTGSKGKGSTSTLIASVLHESGYKTALYTSPHLHDYVERIQIDMLPVSRFDFADGIEEIRDAIEEVNQSELGPVSTFGAMNALFFHLCKNLDVEWQVVEVGLGGRHDATNVFDEKALAVITAVSLEHTAILGNTCAEIAEEKSGIIVPGCTAILGAQNDPEVRKVVAGKCTEYGARLVDVSTEYSVTPTAHDSNGQSFVVQSKERKYNLHTYMLGLHQLQNAATAVAACEAIMKEATKLTPDMIEDGIANVEMPGRIEQLTRHPITVIDGAHNGESMRALMTALDRHFDYEEFVCVLGVNQDKNLGEILEAIKSLEPKLIIATKSSSQRAMAPSKIADAAKQAGFECRVTQNVDDAISTAKEFAGMDDLICITGSLYVVGEAREKILVLPVMH
jgi:dihydrofolate synthase / folylpolyglutamate synthase